MAFAYGGSGLGSAMLTHPPNVTFTTIWYTCIDNNIISIQTEPYQHMPVRSTIHPNSFKLHCYFYAPLHNPIISCFFIHYTKDRDKTRLFCVILGKGPVTQAQRTNYVLITNKFRLLREFYAIWIGCAWL